MADDFEADGKRELRSAELADQLTNHRLDAIANFEQDASDLGNGVWK